MEARVLRIVIQGLYHNEVVGWTGFLLYYNQNDSMGNRIGHNIIKSFTPDLYGSVARQILLKLRDCVLILLQI